MIPDWVVDYIGIPFAVRGRTREGCDCWGLVRLVLAEHYGKDLPAFDGYKDHRDLAALGCIVDASKPLVNAERLDGSEEGAVVVMTVRGHPCHVGICVDSESVLHVEFGSETVLEKLGSKRLSPRIDSYWRIQRGA